MDNKHGLVHKYKYLANCSFLLVGVESFCPMLSGGRVKMAKRAFLVPMTMVMALFDGHAIASVTETVAPVVDRTSVTETAPSISSGLTLERSEAGDVLLAAHSSHASHGSHGSHASHCSGYTYC